MNLLNLASDIQKAILLLAPVKRGGDPVIFAKLQPITAEIDWAKQPTMWRRVTGRKQQPYGEKACKPDGMRNTFHIVPARHWHLHRCGDEGGGSGA